MAGKRVSGTVPAWLSFRGRLGFSAVGIVLAMAVGLIFRQIPLGSAHAQVPIAKKTAANSPAAAKTNQAGAARPANPNNPAAMRNAAAASRTAKAINIAELKVMAVVNGQQITRATLAQECLLRYGEEVLESMINRMLISQACQQANIKISEKDVQAEIGRVAQKFGLTTENWIKLLEEERGVPVEQYRAEIIWPTIALRMLAANEIQVNNEELKKAFETEYGPKVRVRVIGTSKEKSAREALAKAKANPAAFPELAKTYCEDPNIASVGGAIPPIRKHLGDANLERVAFSLKVGQVSDIIKVQNQYFVLLCEGHEPERFVAPQLMKMEEDRLRDRIRDQKLRSASTELFTKLQEEGQVVNVYNDEQLRKEQPGVAATINNKPITMAQLSEECLRRNGREVLEGEINRKLLAQELTKKNMVVKQEDLDEEVARAAVMYGCVNTDGTPDVDKWLKQVQEKDGATIDLYIRDAVWPSVALKKLVRDQVSISEDDLKKGFESNYGQRVEVLAIVLSDQRQAQRVWEMARNNPTAEYFGELAAQYSVEPVSKGNNGKVPPVRKHGGQPKVEAEAFKLKKGELSSLITIGDKTIILHCLGRTQPVVTRMEDVRSELEADILEKKLTAEMSKQFEAMRMASQIDNFLAGTSQAARNAAPALTNPPGGQPATKGPSARVGSLPAKGQ